MATSIRQGNEIAKEGLAIMMQGHEIAKEGLAIMMQGHEIAKERLAIMERGRPRCYSDNEVFSKLVNIGISTNVQLDAMLILIKDPTKIRAFFGVPTSELHRQILLKMNYAKEP